MKRCGSNRWWVEDATLVIQRRRSVGDMLLGALTLSASAVLVGLFGSRLGLLGVAYVVAMAGYGVYSALGAWEVTLHRVTGRVRWRWGVVVPFVSRERTVTDTERIQLVTQRGKASRSAPFKSHEVGLAGVTSTEPLAGSGDRGEAAELAEAVARHMRLGLQVDDGRVRAVEELDSPERARALARMEARLLGTEASGALASPRPVEPPLPPPPGCGIQVRAEGERRVVELPAPGWGWQARVQAFIGGGVMLAPLWGLGFLFSRPLLESLPRAFALLAAMTAGLGLMVAGIGGFVVYRAWVRARRSWRLTVSRRGLEVVCLGPGAPVTTRLAAGLIEDIDVREQVTRVRLQGGHTLPMLVIGQRDGEALLLGEGLPREELEWVAARVRQELAALSEARRQERDAG